VKHRTPASSHKKVIVRTLEQEDIRGYLNPSQLGNGDALDLLSPEGQHQQIPLKQVKAVYFVNEFAEGFEPERKAFVSRPKLDGLWVRMKFRDNDTLEGVVPNDLLELLDRGIQITPPDLHGPTARIYVPRSALTEMTVLGVVGVARRKPSKPPLPPQPKLFSE
jgi:hypothetical protein